MRTKFFICAGWFAVAAWTVFLLDFFQVFSVEAVFFTYWFIFVYFLLPFEHMYEYNHIPLQEKYDDELLSITNKALDSDIMELRKFARDKYYFDWLVSRHIIVLFYPLLGLGLFIGHFSEKVSDFTFNVFYPDFSRYFFKNKPYKEDQIIEDGKKLNIKYYTDGKIKYFFNGKLHRESGCAVEFDLDNGHFSDYENSLYAFGKKYETEEELKKAIISKKVGSF